MLYVCSSQNSILSGDYSLLNPRKRTEDIRHKTILNDVSVRCASGQVLAMWVANNSMLTDSLGGSGSGKTTLLNAVAYRLGDLPLRAGNVTYMSPESGRTLGSNEAKRRTGFVRQQDFLVECLTGVCCGFFTDGSAGDSAVCGPSASPDLGES